MPAPAPVPPLLLTGPFTVAMARDAGLPVKALRSQRFVQLLRGVHVHRDHPLTQADWIRAATLAAPERARLSHLTRIQALGLDLGSDRPFHFTVTGDLHLAMRNVFLHRTPVLPPTDAVGVTPTAAFLGACSWERLIDLVQIGDWLLHHGHMTVPGLVELARHDDWRAGAPEAIRVARLLDGRSRSVRESETRALIVAANLPVPEVNRPVLDDPDSPVGDLWYPRWRLCVEYEGGHHFTDRAQGVRDVWRYSLMRDNDIAYLQVTKEMINHPRATVIRIHQALASRGYDGPPPEFGARWHQLFTPLRPRPTGGPKPSAVG
jgi:hypothetical protein